MGLAGGETALVRGEVDDQCCKFFYFSYAPHGLAGDKIFHALFDISSGGYAPTQ